VKEVRTLGGRRQQAEHEVDEEDQGERDVHVRDQPPRLGPERQDAIEREVDDQEDRDGKDEELVRGALQVLATRGRRDIAHEPDSSFRIGTILFDQSARRSSE
jgi:hypothetical protein